jgi:hypothetical protein
MAKVLPWGSERRDEERRRLHHAFPLNVVRDETGESITCQLQDLSPEGLCVLVREQLAPGTKLRFVTLKRDFHLEVAWCEASGPKDLRCGLSLTDKDDMRELFAGFLSDRSVV